MPAMHLRGHILLPMLLTLLAGCYYDTEEELYPSRFCERTGITYAQHIAPIIQARCAIPGCHVSGGTGPGAFTSYSAVKAAVDQGSFRSVVLDSRAMPPGSPLTACQLDQIGIWLDAGAPDN